MKYSKRKLTFFIFEVLFSVVIPILIGISSCMDKGLKVRIGAYGITLAIILFYLIKKLFINKRVENLKGFTVHLKSELAIETDAVKINNIRRALAKAQVFEVIATAITPIGLLSVFLLVSKSIEAGIAHLSGAVGLILLSVIIGTIFAVLNASVIRCGNGDAQ